MSCSNNCSSANSMFGNRKSNKAIKFTTSPSGASLSVVQGATTLSKIELCDWSKCFSQYSQSSVYIESGALNRPIEYGAFSKN